MWSGWCGQRSGCRGGEGGNAAPKHWHPQQPLEAGSQSRAGGGVKQLGHNRRVTSTMMKGTQRECGAHPPWCAPGCAPASLAQPPQQPPWPCQPRAACAWRPSASAWAGWRCGSRRGRPRPRSPHGPSGRQPAVTGGRGGGRGGVGGRVGAGDAGATAVGAAAQGLDCWAPQPSAQAALASSGCSPVGCAAHSARGAAAPPAQRTLPPAALRPDAASAAALVCPLLLHTCCCCLAPAPHPYTLAAAPAGLHHPQPSAPHPLHAAAAAAAARRPAPPGLAAPLAAPPQLGIGRSGWQ